MSTQQYRLLEVGEVIQSGDEAWNWSCSWSSKDISIGSRVLPSHVPFRRPITSTWPTPIAMSERRPTEAEAGKNDVVLGFCGKWAGWSRFGAIDNCTHWLPVPPAPSQPDPDEAAFEAWRKSTGFGCVLNQTDVLRATWNAALAHARGGAK